MGRSSDGFLPEERAPCRVHGAGREESIESQAAFLNEGDAVVDARRASRHVLIPSYKTRPKLPNASTGIHAASNGSIPPCSPMLRKMKSAAK